MGIDVPGRYVPRLLRVDYRGISMIITAVRVVDGRSLVLLRVLMVVVFFPQTAPNVMDKKVGCIN